MTVTVVDIGSNSIKALVVTRAADGRLTPVAARTIDARISTGIDAAIPRLSADAMARGLEAIQSLLADAAPFQPQQTILVATSAVRDAANGPEFREKVQAATGHAIRILTGDEEANLIGRGLTCDPALADLRDFLVFDLGGGSLECLRFQDRRIEQAVSLQLGCVRMTERFIDDVSAPLVLTETTELARHVCAELKRSAFRFPLVTPPAIFTGGSMTTVRALKAALHDRKMEDAPAVISTESLFHLLDELAPLTLEQRKAIPGMPAARADVFPAAVITMLSVAEYGHISSFQHSLYNLRWGLAAEALES
jgi:exopolyphosphatase/guanosine-5'-triphosphate,3'-diphosphate pyrophosphatase